MRAASTATPTRALRKGTLSATDLLLLDLDHTLFDPESIPRSVMEPVFARLWAENRRRDGVGEAVLEASIDRLMGTPISQVAQEHGWPEWLRRLCLEESATVTLPPTLPLYPDAEGVAGLRVRKVLVTTGVPAVQWQKVRALGIEPWLEAVHVDDVLAVPRRWKRGVFEEILAGGAAPPDRVVVVGDNLESEIAAGRALGLRTVHVARAGCGPACPATHCMPDLRALGTVL